MVLANIGGEILQALSFAFGMFWEVLWALILGFALSGAIQALVSKNEMRRLMPDDSPRTLGIACGLGAASSSCSYAAVALARSLFRKGADFTAAMAFEFASTNLVSELGIIIALLLGWQFTVGEFVGGPLMIVLMALVFRVFLRRGLVDEARVQADRGVHGRMEGHAEMDMSVQERAPLWRRLTSPQGFTATANYFVMDWVAIWVDVFDGLNLIPEQRDAKVIQASVTLDYTTVLNIVFLAFAGLLVWRYFTRGGGLRMLRMMNRPLAHEAAHGHGPA